MARQQQELPTMQTASGDETIDKLAVNFKQLSKKRKRAQDAEILAREDLEKAMKLKKLTVYEVKEHDLLVTLSTSEKVKVTDMDETAAPAPDDAEGDDDEIEMAGEGEQKARKKKPKNGEAPAEA
jgi:hypothetical protein